MNNGRVQDDLVEQFENFFNLILVYTTRIMQYQKQLEQQKITIRDAVFRVFKGFHIKKDFSSDEYEIRDESSRKSCMQFEFMDHESIKKHYPDLPHNPRYRDLTVLHISSLSKCGANNGNRLLALVDELVESIPFIEHITLRDASNIRKCDVRLGLNELSILTSETGESWYNRWGYKSPIHHAGNMRINSELRNGNMREFLDVNPLLQSAIMDAFPELNTNVSVHECVKSISEQIRLFPEERCSPSQIAKISALNMLIGELRVEYSKGLVKSVEQSRAALKPLPSPKGSHSSHSPKGSHSSHSSHSPKGSNDAKKTSHGGNKRRRNKQHKKTVKRRS